MFRSAAVCLAVALPCTAQAQTDTSTPEAAAAALTGTVRDADWDGMAALMHPDALRELRNFLEPLLRLDDAAEFRELLGIASAADLPVISDARLFAHFIEFTMTQDPTVLPSLRTATVEVIGHVPEGDTTHVVTRFGITFEGISITKMEVSSFRPTPDGWRALLTGDISAIAQALRQALNAPTVDPR